LKQLIFNPFFLHRSLIAVISLAMLMVAMYTKSYDFVEAMASAQFWANLLSFGMPIHFRRSKIFINDYRQSLASYTIMLVSTLIFATYAKYTLIPSNISYLLQLSVLHLFSLILFSASTYYKGRHFFLIFFDVSTLAICYLGLIFFNGKPFVDTIVVFLIISKVFLIFMVRNDLFHTDATAKTIEKTEIIAGAISNSLAVLPMILVTELYFIVNTETPPYAEFFLRINAIFSIVFISSFSFLKSRGRKLNDRHQTLFILSYALCVIIICYFTHLYIELGAIEDEFYIALLPLITTSAAWAKQNILFDSGPSIILMFNFIVSALIFISGYIFNLELRFIFLQFLVLYTFIMNFYFLTKNV